MYSRILLGLFTLGIVIASQACSANGVGKKHPRDHIQHEGWKTVTSKSHNFSVEFPTKPKIEQKKSNLPHGEGVATSDLYVSAKGDGPAYFVSITTYKPSLDMSDPNSHLKGALHGMMRTLDDPHVEMSEFTKVDGNYAIKFKVIGDRDLIFEGMYIIADDKLYQVFVVYHTDQEEEAHYEKFYQSFEFLNH